MSKNKGILRHNDLGRLAFSSGYCFTSGDRIKILWNGEWIEGRIEYSHFTKDYYFTNEDGESIHDLEGIEAVGL